MAISSNQTSRRAIIVRGHIESFCSAGDTREYAPIGAEPEFGKRAVLTYIRAVKALRSIGKPTIALHDGAIEMPSNTSGLHK